MIAALSAIFGGVVHKVAGIGFLAAIVLGAVVIIYTSGERTAKTKDAVSAIKKSEHALEEKVDVQKQIIDDSQSDAGRRDIDKRLRKDYSRD